MYYLVWIPLIPHYWQSRVRVCDVASSSMYNLLYHQCFLFVADSRNTWPVIARHISFCAVGNQVTICSFRYQPWSQLLSYQIVRMHPTLSVAIVIWFDKPLFPIHDRLAICPSVHIDPRHWSFSSIAERIRQFTLLFICCIRVIVPQITKLLADNRYYCSIIIERDNGYCFTSYP